MDKKEIRLNQGKRKSLVLDFRRHCESMECDEKSAYEKAKVDAIDTIDSSFKVMKEVVERKYQLEDVAELQRLQRKYNTVNAVGTDSCFFMNAENVKEVDQYGDEVEKTKHFSYHLDGGFDSGNDSRRYYSGSQDSGKNFAYAMYRDDMKAVGLNPDCNIEADITYEKGADRYDRRSNPWLATARNDNEGFLKGKSGSPDRYQEWEDKYQLHIIGTGGCRSRAIPCTDLEFAKFEMMHHAKQEVVKQHTAWIQIVVARVDRFKEIVKTMTKFSQVEDFAKQFGWVIAPEILADKIGMDLVISIDDAVDSIMNIGKKAPSREDKIKARILYNAQQSSLAS
jgi:hypothetical protein